MNHRRNAPLVLQGTRAAHSGMLGSAEGSVRVSPEGIVYPLPGGDVPQSRPGQAPIVLTDARPDPEEIEAAADEAVRQAVAREMRGPKKVLKFGLLALAAYGVGAMIFGGGR